MSSRPSPTLVRRFDHPWHWSSVSENNVNSSEDARNQPSFTTTALRHAIAMISDGVYVLDGDTLVVRDVNPAACELLGRLQKDVVGYCFTALCNDSTPETNHREIGNSARRGANILTLQQHAQGHSVPVELRIRPLAEQDRTQLLVTVRDLSDRHRADKMARTPAFTDTLTGMPDRRACEQFLQSAIALRLKSAFREEDTVARYGGDEFVALVRYSNSDADFLHRISARIDASLSTPISVGGASLEVSASVGVAQNLKSDSGPREVIAWADESMYTKKSSYRRKNGGIRLHAR